MYRSLLGYNFKEPRTELASGLRLHRSDHKNSIRFSIKSSFEILAFSMICKDSPSTFWHLKRCRKHTRARDFYVKLDLFSRACISTHKSHELNFFSSFPFLLQSAPTSWQQHQHRNPNPENLLLWYVCRLSIHFDHEILLIHFDYLSFPSYRIDLRMKYFFYYFDRSVRFTRLLFFPTCDCIRCGQIAFQWNDTSIDWHSDTLRERYSNGSER